MVRIIKMKLSLSIIEERQIRRATYLVKVLRNVKLLSEVILFQVDIYYSLNVCRGNCN